MTTKDKPSSEATNFEDNLQQLESLVERLEKGDMDLDESLKAFETGVKLTRNCQSILSKAEQKVKILLNSNDGDELQDFAVDET